MPKCARLIGKEVFSGMLQVQLTQFQGPLDLLLHLISRAKIDIRDIFVSEITEQYMQSIRDLSALDMETASEFLQMAATLLEIKSRALLPKPPRLEELIQFFGISEETIQKKCAKWFGGGDRPHDARYDVTATYLCMLAGEKMLKKQAKEEKKRQKHILSRS